MEKNRLKWSEKLWKGLLGCVEGLYIIEEDKKTVLYVNSFLYRDKKEDVFTGHKCFEVFAGRQTPCPACPPLDEYKETEGPYMWDYFDPISRKWMNIKNCLVTSDGVRYRIGNVNIIEDVMGLGSDAVRELGFMNRLIREHENMKDAMEHEISHDRLTGLLNRNQYMRDIEHRYQESSPVGVLFLDLNNLKQINDRYHHCEGDRILCRLANAMKEVDIATGAGDCRGSYRIGGDEFIVIWEGCTEEELEKYHLDILQEIARRNEKERFPCSVAIGAVWSCPAGKLERLATEADQRMYEEKKRMKENL